MKNAYQKLLIEIRELYALRQAQALLSWDQETMMPAKAGEGRSEAIAALSKVLHERYCSPHLGETLAEATTQIDQKESQGSRDSKKALLYEFKRDRDKILKIPTTLAEELAKTTSQTQQIWAETRQKNDTQSFNPWLKKVLELRRQEAECLGYEGCAYDAMLDQYEVGLRVSTLTPLFRNLKNQLIPLLNKIREAPRQARRDILKQNFSIEKQKIFNQIILTDMGFDLDAGRLDVSAHPFTEGLWPQDVRLTTRYREDDLPGALFSTLHEGGHGLYEQGFLPENYGGPLAEAVSLGIHESQSRLWENQVGRSSQYWTHYLPILKDHFPDQLASVSLKDFTLAINAVTPSLIRVEADELTYNLHIIVRYELEQALFSRQLEVDDLEEAWKAKYQEVLGVTVSEPKNGYMQDVHWSCGLMGYFPTYTLGNMYGAQFFAAARTAMPNLDEQIERGSLLELRNWLGKEIHCWGRQYSPRELVKKVTGKEPDPVYLSNYLEQKYKQLYGF